LDADGGLLLTADADLGDARNLADLLGELGLDIVVDRGQRQDFRGRGEWENPPDSPCDRSAGSADFSAIARRPR